MMRMGSLRKTKLMTTGSHSPAIHVGALGTSANQLSSHDVNITSASHVLSSENIVS